jgi:hypothetical protein
LESHFEEYRFRNTARLSAILHGPFITSAWNLGLIKVLLLATTSKSDELLSANWKLAVATQMFCILANATMALALYRKR